MHHIENHNLAHEWENLGLFDRVRKHTKRTEKIMLRR